MFLEGGDLFLRHGTFFVDLFLHENVGTAYCMGTWCHVVVCGLGFVSMLLLQCADLQPPNADECG
eukprot:4489197-Amphidinium_carterae.1